MPAHHRYPRLRKPSILIAIIFSAAILIGASFSLVAASSPPEKGVNALQETLETPPSPLDTVEPPVSTPTPTSGWVPTATVTQPGVFTPTLAFTPTPTPTLAIVFTPTLSVTPGAAITATPALTVTAGPTVTLAPTDIPPLLLSPAITVTVYLPGVYDPGPTVPLARTLFCASPGRSIPDNNSAGINSQITINDNRFIADLDAQLNIVHTWVGDISVQLRHDETGRSITLIDRPGYPANDQGCSGNNIKSILDDEMSTQAENKCAGSPAAVAGSYLPKEVLSAFDGDLLTGTWTLTVADNSRLDTGSLSSWCLLASVSPNPPPTPPPPPPPNLPNSRNHSQRHRPITGVALGLRNPLRR